MGGEHAAAAGFLQQVVVVERRVEPEQRNKKILDGVRAATFKPLIECLKSIDQDLLKGAIAGEKFSELFFASCKDEELAAYIKSLLA